MPRSHRLVILQPSNFPIVVDSIETIVPAGEILDVSISMARIYGDDLPSVLRDAVRSEVTHSDASSDPGQY